MEFDELALAVLRTLPDASLRHWDDESERTKVLFAALDMAAKIKQVEVGLMAAGDLLIVEGTTLLINGEVGADYALSFEGVANNAGRVSARIDLGASPRASLYRWRCKLACQATPTQYNTVRLYKSESDGTYEDGDVGTADAAVTEAQLANMRQFGSVVIDTADTSDQIAGGVVEIHERYVSIAPWNASGATINGTDSNFVFELTPIIDQVQQS